MSFDPSKPFEVEAGFDPSKPFEVEGDQVFDPSKPFDVEPEAPWYERMTGGIVKKAGPSSGAGVLEQTMGALVQGDIPGFAKGAAQSAPTVARVGVPLGAAIAAPITGGASLAASIPFYAAGGALGEAAARVIEGGPAMSPMEMTVAAAGGATMVPAAPTATMAQRALGGIAEGVGITAGSAAAQGRVPTAEELAVGTAMMAGGRLIEGGLTKQAPTAQKAAEAAPAAQVAEEVPVQPAQALEAAPTPPAQVLEPTESRRLQLAQDFELARMEEAKQRQMLALDAKKTEKPVMGMPETPVATPKTIIGVDVEPGPQLSQQARRMQEEYGRIDPRVVLAMARGGVGAAIGAYIGDNPEEKAMYGLLGAAAGVMATKTMANAISRQLTNLPADKVKAKVIQAVAPHRALGREILDAVTQSEGAVRAYYQKAGQLRDDLTNAIKRSADPALSEKELTAYMNGDAMIDSITDTNVKFYAQLDRQLVDDISDRAVAEGAVLGKMKDTFLDNKGRYLYRGYRVFLDPGYVPDARVYDKAVGWIKNNWEQGKVLPDDQARGIANGIINKEEAASFWSGASKIGGKDISVLIRRKDLAPEIRELMGEITNPIDRVVLGIPHAAKLVEGNALQKQIREIGLRTGLFTETPSPTHHATLVDPTAQPTRSSYPSYKGLYMTPEVRDAMMTIGSSGNLNQMVDYAWQTYKTWNAAAKVSKTVFNPESYVPNAYGGAAMVAMNGHLPFRFAKDSFMLTASDLGLLRLSNMLPADRQAFADLSNKLTALGVRNDNLSKNDIAMSFHKTVFERIKDTKAFKIPFGVYGQTDDFFKTIAWFSERAKYAKAYPNTTADELDRLAASRVTATMPTFSKVPKVLREASAFGITPTFISFTAEVFRNTYNATRIGLQDIKEGMASGNQALVGIGAKRLTSTMLATAAASGAGIAAWSAKSNGISSDREQAIRDLGPTWNKNSPLFFLEPVGEDGKTRIMNLSYLLPQAVTTQAVTAAFRGQSWEEGFSDAIKDQWFGGGILTEPVISAIRGETQSGRPIRDPQAGLLRQSKETASYVADETLRPGFVNTIKRGIMAATGEEGPGGQVWTAKDVTQRLAGLRSQTIDLHKAYQFKLGNLAGQIRDAQHKYTALKDRNLDPAKMQEAYQDSEASRKVAWEKTRDIFNHYRQINLNEEKAIKLARDAGLSSEMILGIIENTYTPQKVMNAGKDAFLESVATMSKAEAKRAIVSADAITAPKIISRFMEAERERASKLSEADKLIKSLDSETQLNYINRKLGQIEDPSERRAVYEDYRRRGILHAPVVQAIRDQAKQR